MRSEPYYRPLTASLNYAGMFYVFGLNGRAMRLVLLTEVVLVGWLLALVVLRESGSPTLAGVGALLYAVHPSLPDSTTGWLMAQQHACSSLVWC